MTMPEQDPDDQPVDDRNDPYADPATIVLTWRDYPMLPWYRKSEVCSNFIVAHLLVMLLSCCVPFVSLLGLITSIGIIAVCVSVLTGPVYYKKPRKDGTLKVWSNSNKVAAVILLILFVGGNVVSIVYLLVLGQQIAN